jgi:predicted permease
MNSFLQDLRYAGRNALKSPVLTLAVILSIALGIGANTAVFSLIDQVVLRPLPVSHPEDLVLLSHDGPYMGSNRGMGTFSNLMYRDLNAKTDVLAGLAASYSTDVNLGYQGQTERVTAMLVSGNYFRVLGVSTAMGRPILPEDDVRPGAHPVVVLSHGYWMRRFGSNPGILNQTLLINGFPMTVIGIAPRGFHGAYVGRSFDVMTPIMMKAEVTPSWNDLDRHRSLWLSPVGRLRPGVNIKQAEASLIVLYQRILSEEIKTAQLDSGTRRYFDSRRVSLEPGATGRSDLRRTFQTPLIVLMTMAGLVLLIACANVANLLIARSAARQKEVALRLALGASRWRIARQVLTESLALSVGGGALGLVIAVWSLEVLVGFLPSEETVHALSTSLDPRVLAFAFAAALATSLLFGLTPALQSMKTSFAETLKNQSASLAGALGAPRVRQGLVVTQVALSLLLLIGCGLFARTLYSLEHENPGFPVERLATFSIDARSSGYSVAGARDVYRRLQEQFTRLPGVRGVSMSETTVLRNQQRGNTVKFEGYQAGQGEYPTPYIDLVGPQYFATMGMPVVAGREFTEGDFGGGRLVAMINESTANQYFKGQNPVGKHIYFGIEPKGAPDTEIVGVVRDAKYHTLRDEPKPFTFLPMDVDPQMGAAVFYVRTYRPLSGVVGLLRKTVRDEDANLTLFGAKTMEQSVGEMLYIERLLAFLSSAFGLLATLLAAIGLYGVLAYNVTRRTREIGIRMAMGASTGKVFRTVLREVAILTAIGAVIAIPASRALSRLFEAQLFGISANDPVIVAAATVFLALVALAAGFVPALRAARSDPMTALRFE